MKYVNETNELSVKKLITKTNKGVFINAEKPKDTI
jgi:hypothetical protein